MMHLEDSGANVKTIIPAWLHLLVCEEMAKNLFLSLHVGTQVLQLQPHVAG